MLYSDDLIKISQQITTCKNMYSIVLIDAENLSMKFNDVRCFISGKYILCLNSEDKITDISGSYTSTNLQFDLYFINVNLSIELVNSHIYYSLCKAHSYPDFKLFLNRCDDYFGIIRLTDDEFQSAWMILERIKRFIADHKINFLWSCCSRGEWFALMRIAESAYTGDKCSDYNEILRYINENLGDKLSLPLLCEKFSTNRTTLSKQIKNISGLPPVAYILEQRLDKSRLDLLFTEIPIGDIAEKFGFEDANYYIRTFKKRYKKTPLQYRISGRAARPQKAIGTS